MAPRKPVPASPVAHLPQAPATPPGPQVPARRGPLVVNLPQGSASTQVPAAAGAGAPDAAAGTADAPDLRLPHERDQSAVGSTAATPDPVVVQAAKDLKDGLVDTDLRNPGGLDGPRRRQLIRDQARPRK